MFGNHLDMFWLKGEDLKRYISACIEIGLIPGVLEARTPH